MGSLHKFSPVIQSPTSKPKRNMPLNWSTQIVDFVEQNTFSHISSYPPCISVYQLVENSEEPSKRQPTYLNEDSLNANINPYTTGQPAEVHLSRKGKLAFWKSSFSNSICTSHLADSVFVLAVRDLMCLMFRVFSKNLCIPQYRRWRGKTEISQPLFWRVYSISEVAA